MKLDLTFAVVEQPPELEDRSRTGEIANVEFFHTVSIPGSVNRLAS